MFMSRTRQENSKKRKTIIKERERKKTREFEQNKCLNYKWNSLSVCFPCGLGSFPGKNSFDCMQRVQVEWKIHKSNAKEPKTGTERGRGGGVEFSSFCSGSIIVINMFNLWNPKCVHGKYEKELEDNGNCCIFLFTFLSWVKDDAPCGLNLYVWYIISYSMTDFLHVKLI